MSFFKRLLGQADPLATMRRYHAQGRWAEVLALAERCSPEQLDAESRRERESLLQDAGDRLARLNLEEAEACLRGGDPLRARDHLELAVAQACSDDLRGQAREALAAATTPAPAPAAGSGQAPADGSCGPACGSGECGPAAGEVANPPGADLDLDTRLELSLGAYPEMLVEAYRSQGEAFRRAVVLVHEGDPGAEAALDRLPESERTALFHFERGTLHGRSGRLQKAIADLKKTLQLDPAHPLAGDVLFSLQVQTGDLEGARNLLERMAQGGYPEAYCLARGAFLAARGNDPERALELGRQAREKGFREPEFVALLAGLEEGAGNLDTAEALLGSLSGSGCGGAAPVPLAEFWLRHGRQIGKAIDVFKKAWRSEPGNPLWALRTAQAYLARGWTDEGRRLLHQVLASPDLPEAVRKEAEHSLERT